jgi:HEAT repeat protein
MDPPATPPGMAPAPPPPAPAPVAMTPGATTLPPGRAMRPPRLPAPADRDPAQPMPFEGLLPPQPFPVDSDLRMQALVSLIDTHSDRVIPLLREIALNDKDPNEARRAVFVLAQSSRKDARTTVVDAARTGPEVVRIAAIREMGRFQEPAFTNALVGIARSDADAAVRDTAIVSLGRTGARLQLRGLYTQLPPGARFAVLSGLFNAKDDDELIRIASTETDQRLRTRARQHLRLLATPKAVKFLTENP